MVEQEPAETSSAGSEAQTANASPPWKGGYRPRGGRRRNKSSGSRPVSTQSGFKGRCDQLNGHIFDVGSTQASRYMKTKKEIVQYAGRTYGAEVRRAINDVSCVRAIIDGDNPTKDMTKEAIKAMDEIQLTVTKEIAKRHTIKLLKYDDDMKKMYSTIHGQCTDAMIQKISADTSFTSVQDENDAIGLLRIIKKICYSYEAQQFPPLAGVRAIMNLYRQTQGEFTSDIEWYEQFENLLTAAAACGGELHVPGVDNYIINRDYGGEMPKEEETRRIIRKKALELTQATIYIENANHARYAGIKEKLENDFLMGQNNYPETLTEAHNILVNYRQGNGSRITNGSGKRHSTDGVMFVQNTGEQGQRRPRNSVKCYRCGKMGHYSYENVCKPADVAAHERQQDTERSGSATQDNDNTQDPADPPDQGTSGAVNVHFTDGPVINTAEDDGIDLYEEEPYYGLMCCTRGVIAAGNDSICYDNILSQTSGKINKDWLLLDNQSTINVICNPALLRNIRKTNRPMYIYCNAGVATTNMVGEFPGVGTVWYHKAGIANILSLSQIKKQHRVTYDSSIDNVFRVHSKDGKVCREFKQSKKGLYYTVMMGETATLFTNQGITTVRANKAKYSALDQKRAQRAWKMQDILNVTTKEMIELINKNAIPNCPVTRDDINIANDLFGSTVVGLKGKTVRRSEPHVRVNITPLPQGIAAKYRKVTLGADIMYVNSIRFFITISRHIQFGTVAMITNAKASTLQECVAEIKSLYAKRGFVVETISMDIQFQPIATGIAGLGITPNFVSQDEHVPEIERYIRTIKELVRGIQCTLPYKRLPGRVTIELVASQVFWWNCLPKPTGVSATMSPRTIITGLTVDYSKHMKLQFGEYVQTHEETDNNTGRPRTIGALALRPTGNVQGGHWFYSLRTGRVINRSRYTQLPMPEEVIERVEHLARNYPEGVDFRNRAGHPIDGDPTATVDPGGNNGDSDDSDADSDYEDDLSVDSFDDRLDESFVDEDSDSDKSETEAIIDLDDEARDDDSEPEIERRDGLRPSRDRSYNHLKTVGYMNNLNARRGQENKGMKQYAMVLHALIEFNKDENAFYEQVHTILLTQYGMKQGIKIFGERGLQAVKTELQQLHDREVVEPVPAKELTADQKAKALAYLMFLKEKRCGKIKGRGCADGRKQRNWMSKEDTTSPTVSIQALMLSCMMDAYEGRDVATADIPGAFLQTSDDSGETHLRLEGVMLKLLAEIDPSRYDKHIKTDHRGRKFLYVKCLKAIYGTLNAALLFWLKLSVDLTKWGFVVNPYDWCVMNKTVNGKQCTILWHVDDIKVSHHNAEVVTQVLNQINEVYGKEAPLVITRGKTHDYLGMTIDFSKTGKVQFTMHDYIENMLAELPPGLGEGESATPAGHHLFDVNEVNPEILSEKERVIYHTNTAKLLFLAKRARPDIQLPVAFLCTRVRGADRDDWKKLDRVMKYLRGSIGLPLILGIDGSGQLKWYIDAAFAVHNDMKSHTGMMMTMGQGAVNSSSSKQKLNTRSSTEAELVGVDDEMTQVIWTRHFLQAQGFTVVDNIVYQDNQSAMKLEKHGKRSSGKRTRHMNIRYFFVTDRISAKELDVEYCPTLDMIADYFTKPLQGSQFRRFRNIILGIKEHDITRYNRNAMEEINARKKQRLAKAAEDDLTKQQLMEENAPFHLEYLDRSLLDGQCQKSQQHGQQGLPRVVRYVGMVQDMLEPEYYESYDSQGRSTHFVDHNEPGDDINNANANNHRKSDAYQSKPSLVERTPLVVVPIPFASDWLHRGIVRGQRKSSSASKSAVVSPVSANRGDRKRDREVGGGVGAYEDCHMKGDLDESVSCPMDIKSNSTDPLPKKTTTTEGKKGNRSTIGSAGSSTNPNADATTTDWWPAGTCGTSKDQCPILAKMCYDQLLSGEPLDNEDNQESASGTKRKQRERPLLLNDLVSMVGVLSIDPFEADFSGQETKNNEFGYCITEDPLTMLMAEIPPPSRLPRLHVLSYRRLRLDDLARRAINVGKMDNDENNIALHSEQEEVRTTEFRADVNSDDDDGDDDDDDDDSKVEWSGFRKDVSSLVPSAFAFLLQEGTSPVPRSAPWIRALWMCLLSEADRCPPDTDGMQQIMRAGPAERALGSISLRLSAPDVTSARSLFRRLAESVLPDVCPIVAAVDLTTATKTFPNNTSFFPRKDENGRLQPCPLQLPKGSVLLIYCPPNMISGSDTTNRRSIGANDGMENNGDSNGKIIQSVLNELVKHHRIPYRFEGGVMIPFEADFRVILVTTQTQEFPCTLSVLTGTGSTMMTEDLSLLSPVTSKTKLELRESLANGRSVATKNGSPMKFSSAILEQAQKDFLERRQRCHGPSASSVLPGEDDFHRWLTLTKLQTKNRRSRGNKITSNKNTAALVEGETGTDSSLPTSPKKTWEPTVNDWKAALNLDDDIRLTA
ncbi:unnamed protein product [Pseudo-nitzschia multistriata]|uniref:Reverse transcriptase Ty1/copia-type domain-containing protein n=1 Tax=Pseudo-nitzschia multistriata TaxID=183589 RepID=A0A448Z8Z1_9STRA|nr:unnamed protein product [Pseudo-nitzschia multistriata]